ncbi:hypothetical protein LMG23992_04044 [Cupriavidus laharis]|uniref:PIN domain-containing protein n=2 Tax=Cupriavidus laharis TaxID=151654 RepID=A0ABM8XI50_9BURK|nr:hypothetical protein LMG23992_04044 [Cupriavidus laharis]
MLHLCLGTSAPGILPGWRLVELHFQARVLGFHTDDLVCIIENATGLRRKVLHQMKMGMTARFSDKAFKEAVGNAWLDFTSEHFNKDEDRILLVYDAARRREMSGAAAVAATAATSLKPEDWIAKLTTPGASNALKRNALDAVRKVVAEYADAEVGDDKLFEFARHLHFLEQDLEFEDSGLVSMCVELIEANFTVVGYKSEARQVWASLVSACMTLNGISGAVSHKNLSEVIDHGLLLAFEQIKDFKQSAVPLVQGLRQGRARAFLSSGGVSHSRPSIEPFASMQDAVPAARDSSLNPFLSRQLDGVNDRIKAGRYQDALDDLKTLGADLKQFDQHQKARWFLMRGACRAHRHDYKQAAIDFLHAAELCDDDEKLAAARVRGHLLNDDIDLAFGAAEEASERFPQSLSVWSVLMNARVVRGATLSEADIPTEFQNEADAWHVVAWAANHAGNRAAALEAGLRALALPGANQFTRDAVLSYALEFATENTLEAIFGILSEKARDGLRMAVEAFEPRIERLWTVQSPAALAITIANLGTAYLLLQQPERTLELFAEARQRLHDDPRWLRMVLEAHRALDQFEEALQLGRSALDKMSAEALVVFSQIAVLAENMGDVSAAADAAKRLTEDRDAAVESIKALRWELLTRSEAGLATVTSEVSSIDAATENSVPLLVEAVQILSRTQPNLAQPHLNRLETLITNESSPEHRYLLAMAYYHARKFYEASTIFSSLIGSCEHSEIHNRLLKCYVRLGATSKAKALLDTMSDSWANDNEARYLAIELAQMVGDVSLLQVVALVQLDREPTRAASWILRLITARREGDAVLDSVLAAIPLELEGSTREQTQIATFELMHGREDQGLRRLYLMRRQHMVDVEAAAAHVSAHMMAQRRLPLLDARPEHIGPGTTFSAIDDGGNEFVRTIDPKGMPLHETENFRLPDSKEIERFLGARVGDEIGIENTASGDRRLRIVAIESAFRTLLNRSHEALRESISQCSSLTIIDLPEDEQGNLDFAQIHARVARRAERGRVILELYRRNPLTLGGVCRLMGSSVVDIVEEWPGQLVRLQVGEGQRTDRDKAVALLSRSGARYVVDAAMLVELSIVDGLSALKVCPKLYCATKTFDLVKGELEALRTTPSTGSAIEFEGELAFVEISEEMRSLKSSRLESILAFIESECELLPSYGPSDLDPLEPRWQDILSDEENAVIALARELDATLLCLDSRLRLIGRSIGVAGIWPQALLAQAVSKGLLLQRDYSLATLKMFLRGRAFVSVGHIDLYFGLLQGPDFANAVFAGLQAHLATDDVEFNSAFEVIRNFLLTVGAFGPCQFGVFLELVETTVEGLARHPQCSAEALDQLRSVLGQVQPVHSREDGRNIRRAIDAAVDHARGSLRPVDLKKRVIYCGNPPWLLIGASSSDASTDQLQTMGEGHYSPESGPTMAANDSSDPF